MKRQGVCVVSMVDYTWEMDRILSCCMGVEENVHRSH